MVNFELRKDDGILIIHPNGSLEAADFQKVAAAVDPYIEANGELRGVILEAESFPGWKDFGALFAHLRFVKDHHRNIAKVVIVSDSSILAIAPTLASHFVQADVRHFEYSEREDALNWLMGR
jgi:hypothetical protein